MSALAPHVPYECLLYRVKRCAVTETFNGLDLLPDCVRRQDKA